MSQIMITAVDDSTRVFKTNNGEFGAFKVWFKTEPEGEVQQGEVVAKADNVERRRTEYKGYINTPTELLVEDQGTFSDGGPKPKKVKVPQKPGGGGGGGGAVAYRNTREGFEAEQAMWAVKHSFEEERRDRRTALMQAVALLNGIDVKDARDSEIKVEEPLVYTVAANMYSWLRETSPGERQTSGGGGGTDTDPNPPALPSGNSYGEGEAAPEKSEGEGADLARASSGPALSPKDCPHEHTSPLRPDGSDMPINKLRCLDCGTAINA